MSYIDELTESLVKVTSTACGGPTEKFVGCAANRSFWVAEASHVLELIDGYPKRFEKMLTACNDWLHHGPGGGDHWTAQPITASSNDPSDLSKNGRRVREAMKRFLARCLKLFPNDVDLIMNDCHTLGIQTPI
jgi:hypothetical protein